ncbi:HEAT repeat domain-containing protein [Streptomyces chilikensis]|uniref:HEAT repeat domain-containing protein n=1 Tax=Streptomyces chilikensis TaxID=1194079 RepID=UPI00140A1969|nr:HEAT repeat domain-containing protein [Streptomyces chilikensis]
MTAAPQGQPAAGEVRGNAPSAGPASPPPPRQEGNRPGAPDAGHPRPAQGGQPAADPPADAGPEETAAPDPRPDQESGAQDATSRLGEGSQRRARLRQAAANVAGDMVGGDKYVVLLGGRRKSLSLLSPLVVEQVRTAYVDHGARAQEDAREALADRRLLVLRGAPGLGKSAMAVRLLLGRCEASAVYHLDSAVEFASLADQLEDDDGRVEPGAGFLLDRPQDISGLDRQTYERVRGALARARAWMVITVAQGDLVDGEILAGVLDVAEETAPAPIRVVEAHVRRLLTGRDAERVMGLDGVAETVEELLGTTPACRQAGELAAELCRQFEELVHVDLDRLREHRTRLEAEDFEIWAEGLPDTAARSFALALAVLNGLPREDIAQAARSLRERLEDTAPHLRGPGPDGRTVSSRDLFATPRRRQLARLRATERDKQDGEPGRVLEYRDPGYPRRIILHAWTQYEIQGELLDWLGELAEHPSEDVRIHAATAVGVLATDSYRHIGRRVLAPWAGSDNPVHREAVAYALAVACHDSWVRTEVADLLTRWYGSDDVPLRATSVRVHGLAELADDQIAEIVPVLAVDDLRLAVAAGYALADLLAADQDAVGRILPELRRAADRHASRRPALLAFLIVASQVVVRTEEVDPDATVPEWPSLLYLAHRRAELREPFRWLWCEALNESFLHREAEQVLTNWAGLAEKDAELREMLRLLSRAVAERDGRAGRVLRDCAETWRAADRVVKLPRTATLVLGQLDIQLDHHLAPGRV